MATTIQRNAIVSPFSVNSDWLDKDPKGKPTGKLATTHQKWVTQVQQGINASPQIDATIPASSAAVGQPGQIAFDSNFLYIAVGLNTWRRVALSIF